MRSQKPGTFLHSSLRRVTVTHLQIRILYASISFCSWRSTPAALSLSNHRVRFQPSQSLTLLVTAGSDWLPASPQVQALGLCNVRVMWTLREIILPVLSTLLTALCAPYVAARGLFPLTGSSLLVSSLVYRFIWQWCLAAAVLWKIAGLIRDWARDLHNSIRDERYLVGRTVRLPQNRHGSEVNDLVLCACCRFFAFVRRQSGRENSR